MNTVLEVRNMIVDNDKHSYTHMQYLPVSKQEYPVKGLRSVGVGDKMQIENLGLIRVDEMDYITESDTLKLTYYRRIEV